MKRPRNGFVLAAAALLLALSACRVRSGAQEPPRPAASGAGGRQSAQANRDQGESAATAQPPSVSAPAPTGRSGGTWLGTVRAGAEATLSARMPMRIAAVRVREGDRVRQGQLLVQMDASDFRSQALTARAGVRAAEAQLAKARRGREAQRIKADADINAARAGVRQAQGKLRQAALGRDAQRASEQAESTLAREGVRKAQAALDRARQTLRSLEELDTVGGVPRLELEGARTQVTVAESDLATAQAQMQRLEAGPNGVSYRVALAQQDVEAAEAGVRQAEEGLQTAQAARQQVLALAEADIRAAEAQAAQARAGARGAESAIAGTRLVSPLDGIASQVAARAGETAQPGLPLVTITSLSGLRVEALLPARIIGRLRAGQSARITVDTQPGRAFPAVVREIARVAEPDGRAFRVTFRFTNPAVRLRPGQTARITLSGA